MSVESAVRFFSAVALVPTASFASVEVKFPLETALVKSDENDDTKPSVELNDATKRRCERSTWPTSGIFRSKDTSNPNRVGDGVGVGLMLLATTLVTCDTSSKALMALTKAALNARFIDESNCLGSTPII